MKTSVYSHYFPQISVGSTRSPYFRSGRYGKRAAEGQVRQETAREQRQRVQSATVSLASGTKGQTMDSAICSERTANETDDGWLAKPAPYRRNGDHRVNRRVRERRWKRKTRMWDRRQPNGSNSDISTGCLVPATQLDEADIRIPDTAHEVRGDTAAERISTVFEGEDRGTNQRVYGASTKNTKPGEVSSYFTCSTVQEVAEAANKKKGRGRSVTAGKSVIPWPPLTSKTFGLIQEELENDTYQVIVAAVFLNKTRGVVAAPLLRQFLAKYPSPLALSQADLQIITAFLRPLGLHHTRANRLVQMGKTWVGQPPTPGMGTAMRDYPASNTQPFGFSCPFGKDGGWPVLGVGRDCIWEIAHLPGVGAYALDSWRIFCLDRFRNGASGKEGEGQKGDRGEEWMRVVPKDKELRAYLRWRWAQEGWAEVGDQEVEVGGRGRRRGLHNRRDKRAEK